MAVDYDRPGLPLIVNNCADRRPQPCYIAPCEVCFLPRVASEPHMKRRDFISLLGGAAAVWPLAAWAQQPAMPTIGFLSNGSPEPSQVAAFARGLSEMSYVEGRNVSIEYHWANNENDRLREMAADLVRRRVAVIAAVPLTAALAAKAATTTIPIVFYSGTDVVQLGLVANLNRPAGNLTGINAMTAEVGPKRLGLVPDMLPR